MQSSTTNPALDLESAYEACRTITRREAKNFYYAFLTLPATKRRAIYAAYAFCRHCD
ncbi:MAG: squalene/phytoene synthase family protein, partial [Chloroflexota bacterium]|nr:squalene/phytoene synthase family protein [Chloroflexota bacterium]